MSPDPRALGIKNQILNYQPSSDDAQVDRGSCIATRSIALCTALSIALSIALCIALANGGIALCSRGRSAGG